MVWTKEEIPEGWLECNGQPVNKTLYPDLYKLMTKTPDYRNIFLQGANGNLGQKIEAGLPNITGDIGEVLHGGQGQGVGIINSVKQEMYMGGRDYPKGPHASFMVTFDASLSNPIYGKSTTVQPPAITVKYIIKAE